MSTRSLALVVPCPHCGSSPGEPCLTPPWPARGQRSRTPLRFSPAHAARIRTAALARGLSEHDADRLVTNSVAESISSYRRHHPPARGVDLNPPQPELELEP